MSDHKETSKHATPRTTDGHPDPVRLRPATPADIPALVPLLVRLKRLNEEFDPLLKVRPDVEKRAAEVLKADLANPQALVLAADGVNPEPEKIVGIVRAQVRERMFYSPEHEGVILDIYLLPAFRRKGVGEHLLHETTELLRSKGAAVVTAEFPTQNEIAGKFYAKRGFRPITALHAKSI